MTLLSISRCISFWAGRKGASPAVTCGDESIGWRELEERSNRLARHYQSLGLGRGDFATIVLPNGIEFYCAAIAVWKLGATPQPISCHAPQVEQCALIELGQPKLVIGWSHAQPPNGVATVPPGFATPDLSAEPLPDMVADKWKALASGGSTGRPKLIVSITPGRFDPLDPSYLMEPEDVMLASGPLYHNASFMFSMHALFCGAHVIVMPRFDPAEALALIDRHGVTWALLVPTMMHRIWMLPPEVREGHSVKSLRIVLHTGAACPAWLKQCWIDWVGPEVLQEGYGGTEGCGAHWISGTEWLAHRGSVGRSQEGFDVRVAGPSGEILPPGEIGEIWSRPRSGPGSTYEYRGGQSRRDADGYESIGDMGYLDAEGYLYLADRRTDLIVSGGANIYPAEVEAQIDSFPGVRASAVIGLPDMDMGAIPHAIVEADAGLDVDELRGHLAVRLSRNKIPRSFEIVDGPLKDEAGKLRRSALRAARIEQG
ncbi:acid--CoA ligase [Sphingobium indicum]|uniref:Acid--CoA ligase n=1 Tax=Sphingobium indicum TaxID=332055 RepID=A0A4Q4J6A5_9SPHN|nr:AMP-binding protein [Sphingobium indicum]NYI23562.1 bile acid-coenzyme A ligase [Sphingobium indicum]RYM01578.1 acid--CoA ligase [Sphingobium indicum]